MAAAAQSIQSYLREEEVPGSHSSENFILLIGLMEISADDRMASLAPAAALISAPITYTSMGCKTKL